MHHNVISSVFGLLQPHFFGQNRRIRHLFCFPWFFDIASMTQSEKVWYSPFRLWQTTKPSTYLHGVDLGILDGNNIISFSSGDDFLSQTWNCENPLISTFRMSELMVRWQSGLEVSSGAVQKAFFATFAFLTNSNQIKIGTWFHKASRAAASSIGFIWKSRIQREKILISMIRTAGDLSCEKVHYPGQ